MGKYERISDAIKKGTKVWISGGFDYDGTLALFIDSVSQIASAAVRQMLVEFPSLIEREMKIDYVESNVLPPNKKIKYSHSHVEVTVTWLADKSKEVQNDAD